MKIFTGIASSTHIDLHREKMTKDALDGMAKQINERYLPYLIEHDPNKLIGVVLYGEVFQLKDGEYALGNVAGLFENEEERKIFKINQPNKVWKDCKKYLNINELTQLIDGKDNGKNYENVKEWNIADWLETHLNSTQVSSEGLVYKIKRYIANAGDLRIEVFPKDHYPAHFHVISKQRGINARFNIETIELISIKEGKIKNDDIKKIQNFFKTHPFFLEKLNNEIKRLK